MRVQEESLAEQQRHELRVNELQNMAESNDMSAMFDSQSEQIDMFKENQVWRVPAMLWEIASSCTGKIKRFSLVEPKRLFEYGFGLFRSRKMMFWSCKSTIEVFCRQISGFVLFLENLESHGILKNHFLGPESHRFFYLVMENE